MLGHIKYVMRSWLKICECKSTHPQWSPRHFCKMCITTKSVSVITRNINVIKALQTHCKVACCKSCKECVPVLFPSNQPLLVEGTSDISAKCMTFIHSSRRDLAEFAPPQHKVAICCIPAWVTPMGLNLSSREVRLGKWLRQKHRVWAPWRVDNPYFFIFTKQNLCCKGGSKCH